MTVQSNTSYSAMLCNLLTLTLVCMFGAFAYAAADGQEIFGDERPPGRMPLNANAEYLAAQVPVKEAKIRGALAALYDSWPEVRSQAFAELDTLNTLNLLTPEQIAQLAALLTSPQAEVRVTALNVLAKIGEPATEFLPQIGALLIHPEADVRAAAVTAIGRLGGGWHEVYVPQLLLLLDDAEQSVRMAAIRALGKLDTEGQSYLPLIDKRLESSEADARSESIRMLEELGEVAEAYIPDIVALLDDADPHVRRNAVIVLGRLGVPDANALEQIARRLNDRQWRVQVAAAQSLCRLSPASLGYIARILTLLDVEDANIRAAVITALGTLQQESIPYRADLLKYSADPSPDVRAAVLDVLSIPGPDSDQYVEVVMARLHDEDWKVRAAAVRTLGNMDIEGEPDVLSVLRPFLQDTDWYVRSAAIKAFANRVPPEEFDPDLMRAALRDPEGSVRASAIWVLGNWERRAAPYLPQLSTFLLDPHPGVRQAALRAVRNLGQVPLDTFLALLEAIEANPDRTPELRFLAHSIGAGDQIAEILLEWMGNPATLRDPLTLSLPQARETLAAFATAQKAGADAPNVLRRMVAMSGQMIIRMKPLWTKVDIPVLEAHAASLRTSDTASYRAARTILRQLKLRWLVTHPRVRQITLGMLHPLVWLGLWIAFPYVRIVRVIFFWNPYVRWALGLGYIHFALIKVPCLRRRLFLPYGQALVSDADLTHFDDSLYEKEVSVFDAERRQSIAIHTAIPALHGKILLEGEAGLGKTTFARYLLKFCLRTVAFLPAEKCAEGVAAAILPKLRGECYDEGFVRALICEGAIDLCIDGLDAIETGHRAKISQFLMYGCRGNILITTRPAEWTPQQGYATYRIQPLPPECIEGFLRKCYRLLPEDIPMSRAEYVLVCGNFLQDVFLKNLTDEELAERQRALTNPLNVTLIALVCASGKIPDLTRLMEQCYQIMADDYQRQNDDHPFPLVQFSERVYRMRLNDEGILPGQRFEKEIACLAKYAMISSRSSYDPYGNATTEWFFRHETIADFFVLQAFLEQNNHRFDHHLGDSRFDGVSALLARAGYVHSHTTALLSTTGPLENSE